MATLRQFDVNGNLNWSTSNANVNSGSLDYFGGGKFLVAETSNGGGLKLLNLNKKSFVLDKTLTNVGDSDKGTGIVVNRSYIQKDVFNGNKIFVTEALGRRATPTFKIYDFNGNVDFTQTISATGTSAGLFTDGTSVYLNYDNGAGQRRIYKYTITGNTLTLDAQINIANASVFDLAFDGSYMWALVGIEIRQYSINGTTMVLENKWTHGATNPLGVTTDENSIYVLSDS